MTKEDKDTNATSNLLLTQSSRLGDKTARTWAYPIPQHAGMTKDSPTESECKNIIVTTLERHRVLNHRVLNFLFISFLGQEQWKHKKSTCSWPFVKGIRRRPAEIPFTKC